jgi:predicted DNA-binding transcriptional regulator YafY
MKRTPKPVLGIRPAIERFALIARLIREKGTFTNAEVAEQMEVTSKTVMRDITFMRDRLGYKINWLPSNNCYMGHLPKERVL